MTDLAIIIGSTRPGRRADVVASWTHQLARQRTDATFTVVDLAEVDLPLLDEQIPPRAAMYSRPHTLRWAETVSGFDGFVFVTPEYNHSVPAVLKNAIDFLYAEWHNKAAAFVGYGADGGTRAVEHLRQIMAEVRVAGVGSQVALSLFDDFVDYQDPDGKFTPRAHQEEALTTMLDDLVGWSGALAGLRGTRSA